MQRVSQVRVLSDGRLLVHDALSRRVLLFDSSLAHVRSIIDTTGATKKAYGEGDAVLFPYFEDSSLFVDQSSGAILVLDPSGVITRLFAAPSNPLQPRFGLAYAEPTGRGLPDRLGRFLFGQATQHYHPRLAWPCGARRRPDSAIGPDTAALLQIGLLTQRVDTIATLTMSPTFLADRRLTVNPLPEADRWTVLNDGTLAIVRAHDYHIDWIASDGAGEIFSTDRARVAAPHR